MTSPPSPLPLARYVIRNTIFSIYSSKQQYPGLNTPELPLLIVLTYNIFHLLLKTAILSCKCQNTTQLPLSNSKSKSTSPIHGTRPTKLPLCNCPGTAAIGAYIDLRIRGIHLNCTEMLNIKNLLQLQVLQFAIKTVNSNKSLLHGHKLKLYPIDLCNGLQLVIHATGFLKYKRDLGVLGVVGPPRPEQAILLSAVNAVLGNVMVAYDVSNPGLTNRNYWRFYGTIPRDEDIAKAIIQVVTRLSWTYIGLVYPKNGKARDVASILSEEAQKADVCVPVKITFDLGDKNGTNLIVEKLASNKRVKAVIVLAASKKEFSLIDKNLSQHQQNMSQIIWILNKHPLTVKEEETSVFYQHGALVIDEFQYVDTAFESYSKSLNPCNWTNRRFLKYFQMKYNCTCRRQNTTHGKPTCDEVWETIWKTSYSHFRLNTSPIINAVYALAYTLKNCIEEECNHLSKQDITRCLSSRYVARRCFQHREIASYIQSVEFQELLSNEMFEFNKEGNVDGKYEITNIWYNGSDLIQTKVGTWNKSKLVLDLDKITFSNKNTSADLFPLSVCSDPCKLDEIREFKDKTSKCCWACIRCHSNDYIINNKCQTCPKGTVPDATRRKCIRLQIEYLDSKNAKAITVYVFSSFGLASTFIIIGVFALNFNHRIVKASSRELSAFMLLSIAIMFSSPFLFLAKPSEFLCSFLVSLLSVSITTFYGPLLLKIIRVYRIFRNARTSTQRLSFVSPFSQMVICLMLLLVQIVISLLSLQGRVVIDTYYRPHYKKATRQCTHDMELWAINVSFPAILIITALILAFKTRNLPKEYVETKILGATVYIKCIAIVIFLPLIWVNRGAQLYAYLICGLFLAMGSITLIGLFVSKANVLLKETTRRTNVTQICF